MGDYNLKITDYAIQPNTAIPLDGRSHFSSFYEAWKTITPDKVTAVENAGDIENIQARWYRGQIITTTLSGTYQVCLNYTATFYCPDLLTEGSNVYWGTDSTGTLTGFTWQLKWEETSTGLLEAHYYLYDQNDNELAMITSGNTWTIDDCCLSPFSGSSGGGGTLTINTTAPLNFDKSTSTLSMQYDTSALKIQTNSSTQKQELTINIDPSGGLVLNNTGLSLKYNQNQFTIDTDNGLTVKGTHRCTNSDTESQAVEDDNYVYQKIS